MLYQNPDAQEQHIKPDNTRIDRSSQYEMKVVQVSWSPNTIPAGEADTIPSHPKTWYLSFKLVFEYVLALILLVFFIPLIVLMAMLVKLTSAGPVIYSQWRLGKNGRPFKLHKIRTMIHNCEETSGPQWASPGDPRINSLGRFLRATHLDELPQLWNVLRGEMSLVGPRPERPEFVPALTKAIPHYRARLAIRPGVTGLAQVQLPSDTDFSSVRRKLAYDLYYIRYLSVWLDLRLYFCTAIHMLGLPFHVLNRLFRLPARNVVEDYYRIHKPVEAMAVD